MALRMMRLPMRLLLMNPQHHKPIYKMKRFTALLLVIGVGITLNHACIAAPLNYEDYPIIKLRSLDKITARTMNFEAKVGSTIRFGDIFIKVQSCRKPPPVEKNEAAAFLQIYQANESALEEKNDDIKSSWIFSGWMFSSSPAISAMDHPIYDVWVLDCLGRDPEPLPPPEQQAADADIKGGTQETSENKDETATDTDVKAAPNDTAPSHETPADSHEPSETKTENKSPATSNEQDTSSPNETKSNEPSGEPSVDEILQPEKATRETGTIPDEEIIYSPPQPSTQNDAPITAPDNSVAPEQVPQENPSQNLDGIY